MRHAWRILVNWQDRGYVVASDEGSALASARASLWRWPGETEEQRAARAAATVRVAPDMRHPDVRAKYASK